MGKLNVIISVKTIFSFKQGKHVKWFSATGLNKIMKKW